VLERISYKLTPFNAGMVVSILFYASGFFFESRLNRHKLCFDAAASAVPAKADSAQSTD